MSDITVAFYKGEGESRDRIVRWWTGSPYSHVELIMPNGTMAGIRPPNDPYIRRRSLVGIREEEWEFIDLSVTEGQLKTIWQFIESIVGYGYDWLGMIASHLTPFKVKLPNKWYCSEWVLYALLAANILKAKPYNIPRIPPGKLYQMIRKIV